jgi:hypothetical protein
MILFDRKDQERIVPVREATLRSQPTGAALPPLPVVDSSCPVSAGETIPELSLLGGPLHRLGCRLGLVRRGTSTLGLGIAFGILGWGVLISLRLLEGHGSSKLFSLAEVGSHVRLLLAIPLLFLCETWVFPEMAEFVRYILRSDMVPEASLPDLASAIRLVGRLKDSWLAEGFFLIAALVLPVTVTTAILPGKTTGWSWVLHSSGARLNWADGWYFGLCLPLFRFLLFRWLWRLGLWGYFLWRVEKLPLRLVATHSDGAAGLGYLEFVQGLFAPFVIAISAVYSAGFAEDISSGVMPFEGLYRLVPMVLLLIAVLFISPLLIFSRKLAICHLTGMRQYMGMASQYVIAFDRKWIRNEKASGESQLGSPDLQTLADLTSSVDVVRNMRWIPAGRRLLMGLGASVLLPLLPLLLLKFPVEQLVARLLRLLTGF